MTYSVHIAHCTIEDGCKYGDSDCPVVNKKIKKSQERSKVKLTEKNLSKDAMYALTTLSGYMTVGEIVKAGELLNAECGENAEVNVTYNEYWGTDHKITWYRDETDEEFEARLAVEAKIIEDTKLARKTAAKVKKERELAELARLTKKYPNKA